MVQRLWDSWSDDAIIVDRASGEYVDRSKLKAIRHKGEFFEVEGPSTCRGRRRAAPCWSRRAPRAPAWTWVPRWPTASTPPSRSRNRPSSSTPSSRTWWPRRAGTRTTSRSSRASCRFLATPRRKRRTSPTNWPATCTSATALKQVGADLKMDLSELEFDEKIPAEWFSDDPRLGSRYQIYRKKSVDMGMTLRELIVDLARSTGHQWMAGTPSQVADRMVDWFESKACDGFNLNAPFNPGGFKLICDKLVPELQDRGYFRVRVRGHHAARQPWALAPVSLSPCRRPGRPPGLEARRSRSVRPRRPPRPGRGRSTACSASRPAKRWPGRGCWPGAPQPA